MPYAPSNNDRSADFIFNAGQNAMDRDLQQQQINNQQSAQAQESMMQALQQFDEQNQLRGMALGKMAGYADSGMMDEATLQKLTSIKNPYELAGRLAIYDEKAKQAEEERYLQAQYQQSRQLADYKAGLAREDAAYRAALPRPAAASTPSNTFLPMIQIAPGIDMTQ